MRESRSEPARPSEVVSPDEVLVVVYRLGKTGSNLDYLARSLTGSHVLEDACVMHRMLTLGAGRVGLNRAILSG